MMKRIILAAAVLCTAAQALYADGAPVERIYVSTDREAYIAGDAVWCSLFCLDEKGRFSDQSAVAYLELVSTAGTVTEAKIGLLEGRGAGQFRIPVTVPTGTYRLIAYTAVNAGEQGQAWKAGSRLLSVYNTTSAARVPDGVELTDEAAYEALARPTEESEGKLEISARTRVRRDGTAVLTLHNQGVAPASVSLSVYHDDSLMPAPQENTPASFLRALPASVTLWPGADPTPEYDGEVISTRVRGTMVTGDNERTVASLSSAGAPSNLYIGRTEGNDRIRFYTSNIYGDREIVCEVAQLDRKEGYIEFESPFQRPEIGDLPRLPLSKAVQGDLSTRKAALRAEKALRIDTLATYMTRREDLMLESIPFKRYHLDDYTRFPSIRETLIEFIPELRLRESRDGLWQLLMTQSDAVNFRHNRTNTILVMMDGVVLSDLLQLEEFDAMLVDDIDIYMSTFACGKVVYNGLVNFVTKKNYVTALHFPNNVRVVDFKGVCYPVAYGGAVPEGTGLDLRQLLYWNPILSVAAGGDSRIEFHAPGYAGRFKVVVKGFAADGSPISREFAFEVE